MRDTVYVLDRAGLEKVKFLAFVKMKNFPNWGGDIAIGICEEDCTRNGIGTATEGH